MSVPDSTSPGEDSSSRSEDIAFLTHYVFPAIFDRMINGVAGCRMLFEDGRPHDFIYLYTNPAFHKLTGLGPVVGRRLSEVLPGNRERPRPLFESYERVVASGASEVFETFVEPLNQWLAIQILSPRPGYFVEVVDVITERKHAEAGLRESEKRYRDLFERANEGLLIMTEEGRVFDVNQAFAEMHGYTVAELKCMDIAQLDVLREKTLEELADITRRIRAGEVVRFEVEHYHKDGHVFPLSVTSSRISLGDRMYYLAFHQDITERRRIEDERKRSAETLEAVMSQLTLVEERERQSIAVDLHDGINQLLAVAKIKLGILARPDDSGDYRHSFGEVVEIIEQADRSTRSLSFQISPPLLFELGLVPALQSLAEELRRVHGLTTTVHDDGEPKDLAPATRSVLYRATRELLMNVAKHAKVNIAHVEVQSDNGLLVISVTDSGTGFDKKLIEKHAPGAGFGLISMRERLRLIGGQFDIDTRPGDGTVATLSVPLARN